MFYTALLKLHILLIAVPGLYGGIGGDAVHHPLIVHVAYLTQQSRAFSVGPHSGSSSQSTFSNCRQAASLSKGSSASARTTANYHPAAPGTVAADFAEVIGATLSPRAP